MKSLCCDKLLVMYVFCGMIWNLPHHVRKTGAQTSSEFSISVLFFSYFVYATTRAKMNSFFFLLILSEFHALSSFFEIEKFLPSELFSFNCYFQTSGYNDHFVDGINLAKNGWAKRSKKPEAKLRVKLSKILFFDAKLHFAQPKKSIFSESQQNEKKKSGAFSNWLISRQSARLLEVKFIHNKTSFCNF